MTVNGQAEHDSTKHHDAPARPGVVVVVEPLLVCGISGRSWQRMHAAGETPGPVRCGSRRRWRLDELREWAAAGCPSRERWETMNASGEQAADRIGRRGPHAASYAGVRHRPP